MRRTRFVPNCDLMNRRITPSEVSLVGSGGMVIGIGALQSLTTASQPATPAMPGAGTDLVEALGDWYVAGTPPPQKAEVCEPELLLPNWLVANPN